MSSGSTYDSGGRKMLYANPVTDSMDETERPGGGGMNTRQMDLNYFWGFYTCQHYGNRRCDWDGKENLDHLETEVVARSATIPPGYFDAGQSLPLKFRKPTAPYYMARVIVNRFTGLLFGEKRAPKLRVRDDALTEDWLNAFVTETRFWSRWMLARTYGGAMGSVAVGFKFVGGRPMVEVFDPRWLTPEFEDEEQGVLRSIEKRYMYPREVRDPKTGAWTEGDFWYRRIIDQQFDTVWPAVPAEKDEEPDWDDPKYRRTRTQHGFGFCPVVWVQNHEVQGDEDGWSDCEGVYDMIEAIDALHAQAYRGTIGSCDPTPVITSDQEGFEDGLRKGSNNAVWLERGGTMSYLEITGMGPKAALELAEKLRKLALEVAQCVLDVNFQGPARTEEEVATNYSSMLETADKLREQYGSAIYRLLSMVLQAVRRLARPASIETEAGEVRVISRVVKLPPKLDDQGNKIPREVGDGELLDLQWPAYAEPSLDDAGKAVVAASQAKLTGLIDEETAVKHIAPYFQIEDVAKVVKEAEKEAKEESASVAQRIMSQAGAGVMSGKIRQ